jgi:hypothetical protein
MVSPTLLRGMQAKGVAGVTGDERFGGEGRGVAGGNKQNQFESVGTLRSVHLRTNGHRAGTAAQMVELSQAECWPKQQGREQ